MAMEWMSMALFMFLYVLFMRSMFKLFTKVTEMVCNILNKMPPDEEALIEELKSLISEQQQISAQDEFPRYARLQRKIDSIKEKVAQCESNRKKMLGKHKRFSKIVVILCLVGIHINVFRFYRSVPVIILPQHWLYPLEKIISFPTGVQGAIGLPCWLVASNKLIERFII